LSDSELSLEGRAEAQFDDGIGRGRLARAAPVLGLTARTAGEAVVAGLRGADRGEFHIRTAERYAELLGRSRGALMKAGQMLSLTPANPAVPAEFWSIYREALARLRDDVPPMAGELAREVLEGELGCAAEGVFAEFDWEPLAAASIGQVHAARLRDGREVAVKIQYPGVADAIAADLKNAELLATFLSLVFGVVRSRPNLDLRGMAREMAARIADELDYRREAAWQAEFAEIYRGHPCIHVPNVVAELCSSRVLTQQLVRGLAWSDALMAAQELRDSWAEAIFRFVYGTNARFCLAHADPHPGNYVFHDDGSVSFLDFGCVKRFRREHVDALGAIGNECVNGNVTGTWRACVEASFVSSSAPVEPVDAFTYFRGLTEMYWASQPFTVTPECAARWYENAVAPTSSAAANALRHSSPSPEYTVMIRVQLGVASLIAQLHAGNHWQSIATEYFDRTPPLTEMGRRERAFFEHRWASFV